MSDTKHTLKTGGGDNLAILENTPPFKLIADLVPAVVSYSEIPWEEAQRYGRDLVHRYNTHTVLIAALEAYQKWEDAVSTSRPDDSSEATMKRAELLRSAKAKKNAALTLARTP